MILLVVDALRADHLSIFGYPRPTTPNLDRLDKAGRLLANSGMHSVCAESSCGLMALSASRYVHQFINGPITLQEVLQRHGYRTHMILAGDHTNFYGLREIYGPLDSFYDGSMAAGRYMNDDGLIIDKLSRFPAWNGDPTFIQFHIMSAHGLGKRHLEHSPFQPARSYYADMGQRLRTSEWSPSEAYTNFYDNGVVGADETIQKILLLLEQKGYLKNSVVVITADHGEMLGEHGKFSHTRGVYEPVLHIPFVMIRAGYSSPDTIPKNVITSQVDIAPTLLAELNIPAPSTWEGIALQDLAAGRKNRKSVFFQQGPEYGLIGTQDSDRRWKYWQDARNGSEHAHNLNSDPAEVDNAQSAVSSRLRAEWSGALMEPQIVAHAQH